MDLSAVSQQCGAIVEPYRMQAIIRVESGGNPYAIGVVHGRLERQPRNMAEAVATAQALERDGWNFSVGWSQVNRFNLPKYDLNYETAFDPCSNLGAGASILKDCFVRARPRAANDEAAWNMAYSCYYSGNFKTGFKPGFKGQPSYVYKVNANLDKSLAIPVRGVAAIARPPFAARATRSTTANTTVYRTRPATPAAVTLATAAQNDAWTVFGAKEL